MEDENEKVEKSSQILQLCFHCGNEGLLNIISSHNHTYGGPIFDNSDEYVGSDFEEGFLWTMLSCPVCKKITLLEDYSNESFENSISGATWTERDVLYPHNKIEYEGVPAKIKSSFESALKIKNIDTAICVLSLRRTLEAICKDKDAKGSDLEAKIRDLISKNVLPTGFDDACWVIRQLGNDAAHADDTVFNIYEVNQLIGFLDTIMNYLYSLPPKIEKLKTSIEKNKETTKVMKKSQEETDNAHT